MDTRLITLAIHTYDHAHALKALLESEGIEVTLQNVNLSHPVVSAGMRVRIHESDLPLALRIIENPDIFKPNSVNSHGDSQEILIPVDFSDYSLKASRIAFHLAKMHKWHIRLLHSYISNYVTTNMQLSDAISFDIVEKNDNEIVRSEAHRLMGQFAEKIRAEIRAGEIPPVKFSTEVCEGLAEEEIVNYSKANNPALIVMGTRGAGKKERELIGSVTAEVLDSCRYPVFTVPESCQIKSSQEIREVVYFCNLDQEDMLGIDALHRYLPGNNLKITLAVIPSKKQASDIDGSLAKLLSFCRENYPHFEYTSVRLTTDSLIEDYRRLDNSLHIDLICVPNKKKNIFARFFNPGIAHKLLFRSDIPMMVIPV